MPKGDALPQAVSPTELLTLLGTQVSCLGQIFKHKVLLKENQAWQIIRCLSLKVSVLFPPLSSINSLNYVLDVIGMFSSETHDPVCMKQRQTHNDCLPFCCDYTSDRSLEGTGK